MLHNNIKKKYSNNCHEKLYESKRRGIYMALSKTINDMRSLLKDLIDDLEKAEAGNKAASQRVRTGTIRLEKVAKLYRKESIKAEKSSKGKKKPAKKKAAAKKPAAKKAASKKPAPKKAAAKKGAAKKPAAKKTGAKKPAAKKATAKKPAAKKTTAKKAAAKKPAAKKPAAKKKAAKKTTARARAMTVKRKQTAKLPRRRAR